MSKHPDPYMQACRVHNELIRRRDEANLLFDETGRGYDRGKANAYQEAADMLRERLGLDGGLDFLARIDREAAATAAPARKP